MDGRFNNPFLNEQEESIHMPENGRDSPFSGVINDGKMATSSSPKRSRRAIQKRVVSVPIGDVDVSRLKGEGAPPSDSWAWRKYGQKPIKGSPYPRGYYRCSSSKGCPARKQVERSRVDPTMLVITYACEHNHPWPASRNSNNNNSTSTSNSTTTVTATATATPTATPVSEFRQEDSAMFTNQPELEPDDKFTDLGDESLLTADDFSWFSDVPTTSPTILESPIYTGSSSGDSDTPVFFPMREEDELLFADLGELPECSVVFRRGVLEQEEERRRCSLREATWCGSSG